MYEFCHGALDLLRRSESSPPNPEQVLQICGNCNKPPAEGAGVKVFPFTLLARDPAPLPVLLTWRLDPALPPVRRGFSRAV